LRVGVYTCDKCGACCRTFPIYASAADAGREPAIKSQGLRLKEWQETEEHVYQLHPLPFLERCAFLDDRNLCRIYGTRPDVCRRFEAGSNQCQQARQREKIPPLDNQATAPAG